MSKEPQTEAPKKKASATQVAGYILMGFVILGLGGFGVTNFGGSLTKIGKVGEMDITIDDYARSVNQEVQAFSQQVGQPITTQQAMALGIDKQALQKLVTRTALDNEAQRIGLSVGDAAVAEQITTIAAFQGTSGAFDRETYRFALDRQNLTEAEFEAGLRRDVARSLLQGAVGGGFVAPAALTETLYTWIAERRGVSVLRLTEADLAAPIAEPTEAELKAFYDANIEALFTRPEAKRITYAALLPEDLAPAQPVDEATLQEMYQNRISEFVIPERRLVERLVYPSDGEAAEAKALFDQGISFEKLVADRGLTLNDIDLGDVSKDDLGAAGEAVFALTEPGLVGPVQSDLGPALFRMNGILAAEETTFDEARTALAMEMQTEAARRMIADKVETIDDLLASGAEVKDLATEAGMTVATIDYIPGGSSDMAIAGYPAFREAADAVAAGDFPEAISLDDGGLVALQLDEILPPAPIPFEDAREDVAQKWRADALATALAARAAEIKTSVEGGASIGTFGIVNVTPELARQGRIEGAPAEAVAALFKAAEGAVEVFAADEATFVIRLDKIIPAATTGDDATALRDAINVQTQQAIATDAFEAFTAAISAEAGISLDQTAITAVNAQFQ